MSSKSIRMRSRGSFLGYKINTTGPLFPRQCVKVLGKARSTIIQDLQRMMKKRLRDRIPKLRTQLRDGFNGGNFRGTKMKRVVGTEEYETTVTTNHTVHIDVTNIWSRLVSTRGMAVNIRSSSSGIEVSTSFYNRRDDYILFYFNEGATPRISTVARRLNETCLRFIEEGNFDTILSQWGTFNIISMEGEIGRYLENRSKALKGT